MFDALALRSLGPLTDWLGAGITFVLTNVTAVVGFLLALLILSKMISEKRNPGNFFAWFFLVLFFPLIGAPLYFMFGGRKSRKSARIKKEVTDAARQLICDQRTPDRKPEDALSGDGVTAGNHFELLPDGTTAFRRLCREIEEAEHTIHIATYILSNDEVGRRVVGLLVKRAGEGVAVRVLLDSLGSWNQTRRARYEIRKAGGEVAMFIPVLPIQTHTSSNLRNHRKIAIFDNYRAITGGQNIDPRFMGEKPDPDRFVDFSVVTQGPAVAELNRTFIADWAFAAKQSPEEFKDLLGYVPEEAGNSTIEVIASGPDIDTDPLWEQLLRMIQEFKRRLTIVTPYFIPDEVLLRSLIVKAHTGRQIQLVMPLKSNHPITDIARLHYLQQLDEAGVEILLYTPRMMHGKLILADGKVGLVGSANIDIRSLFVNFEIALLHYSAPDIAQLQDWADRIIRDCIPFKEAVKKKDFMPSKFVTDIVHLVSPLL